MRGWFDLRVASKIKQEIFVNVSLSIFHNGLEDLLVLSRISRGLLFHRSDPSL